MLLEQIADFLKLLGDPTRMKILKFLQKGEVYVCELGEVLGISQPTVSQHIRRFKYLGLVIEQRQGQRVCYTLDKEAFAEFRLKLGELLDADLTSLDSMSIVWERWLNSQNSPCVRACKTGEEKS